MSREQWLAKKEERRTSCLGPHLPLRLELPNGKPLAEAAKIGDGQVQGLQWTYFDENGAKSLETRELGNREKHFTAFYPDGKKRLEVGYRVTLTPEKKNRYDVSGPWAFYEPSGAQVPSETIKPEQLELQMEKAIRVYEPKYPPDEEAQGREARTCSLVCIDAQGQALGVYGLRGAGASFDQAAHEFLTKNPYEPRRIGGEGLPVCAIYLFKFKLEYQ